MVKKKTSHNELPSKSLNDLYRHSHSVIIGIGDYADKPIPNAVNDARDIKKILIEKYGFPTENIMSLFDKDETQRNILSVFLDILPDPSRINKQDRVIVFYAGHGITKTNRDFDDRENKGGYIIPIDANGKVSSYVQMKTIVE